MIVESGKLKKARSKASRELWHPAQSSAKATAPSVALPPGGSGSTPVPPGDSPSHAVAKKTSAMTSAAGVEETLMRLGRTYELEC